MRLRRPRGGAGASPLDVVRDLLADPASSLHPRVAQPGHSLPALGRLVAYDLDDLAAVSTLAERHQIRPTQLAAARGNVLAVDRDLQAPRCQLRVEGQGAVVVLGQNAAVSGELNVADQTRIIISGQPHGRVLYLKVVLKDRGEVFFWGSGSSAEGFNTSVKGDGAAIVVGDDCMFSWAIWARPFDMHLIIDPVAGEVVNPPRDILVGPHVWIGQSCLLLGGADIGAGSIVGANAVVTAGTHPGMAILAGQPARRIRAGVTWDRESHASDAAIARAQAVYAAHGAGQDAGPS